MDDISFSYDKFIKNNDIDILFDEVKYIDVNRKFIETNDEKLSYDKLICPQVYNLIIQA